MTRPIIRVPLDEFAADPRGILDRVISSNETVIVEDTHGKQAVLRPLLRRARGHRSKTLSDADYEAFLSSAGGWHDVDTCGLKKAIRDSRDLSSRPPFNL